MSKDLWELYDRHCLNANSVEIANAMHQCFEDLANTLNDSDLAQYVRDNASKKRSTIYAGEATVKQYAYLHYLCDENGLEFPIDLALFGKMSTVGALIGHLKSNPKNTRKKLQSLGLEDLEKLWFSDELLDEQTLKNCPI